MPICSQCQSENRDGANFCEQCAAALSAVPDSAEPHAPGPASKIAETGPRRPLGNWIALLAIVAVIGAVAWVVKSPAEKSEAVIANTAATDPHGMPAMGSPHGALSMEDVTKQLEDGKAKLKQNPLDVAALSELYSMYGMIGQSAKMRPYAEAAVAAWKKKGQTDSEALRTLAGVAMAAMQNGDHAGAALALVAYSEADQENTGVVVSIGNLYFEVSHEENAKGKVDAAEKAAAQAIEWYDRYLKMRATATPDQEYWDVTVDRASMLLMVDRANPDSKGFMAALNTLNNVTKRAPDNWGAWHNLGLARDLAGDKAAAVAALKTAATKAADDMRRWESEKELARIEGRAAPPMPAAAADPHAGMDMGGSGMDNPHGELSNPHGEMGNPHGEMGNPHGEMSEPDENSGTGT